MPTETFFNGRLHIHQHPTGYRYSTDALLLAAHVFPGVGHTVVDLGSGCGVIALILAYRFPHLTIHGVEIQKELADIAAQNVMANNMTEQIHILHQDMRTLTLSSFPDDIDIAVANPPFYEIKTGRMNPNRQRAIARHEICITLKDLIQTARRLLPRKGKFVIIYPAERITALLARMHAYAIEPKKLRMVHSNWTAPAKLAIATGIKGGRPGILVEPPLILYQHGGQYTEEVRRLFEP